MRFEDAYRAIEQAGSIDDLSAMLHQWRDEIGLTHIAYQAAAVPALDLRNPLLLLTYDDAWVSHYCENDYFAIDPVVRAGNKAVLPVDWLTVDHHSAEARHFFAEAARHGVGRHGITIPIRGPAGERALFTLNADVTDEHWHRWRHAYLGDVYGIAQYFHDRAMRLAGFRPKESVQPLARRETQCLELLVQGLAPGQIAGRLDLSASAIHRYLRSARRKLDCATVEQAAAKAVRLDLLDPALPALGHWRDE
jgi:DNA-binding CsgD family transcriptional regulator